MRSLVIHMPGTTDRAENVERLVRRLPLAAIIDAVDGRDPDQTAEIRLAGGNHHSPFYPFVLGLGEVGCFMSHRRCWENIVNGPTPYALIAEDDLVVNPTHWPDAIALIEEHADEESYIRLPAKLREKPRKIIAERGAASLFVPRHVGLQTVCQVVGRRAAARLLTATQVLDRPVDTTLQMHWVTGQRMLTLTGTGIAEQSGASTIQKKTRTSGKLMRELRRAVYRTRIRAKPQTV